MKILKHMNMKNYIKFLKNLIINTQQKFLYNHISKSFFEARLKNAFSIDHSF